MPDGLSFSIITGPTKDAITARQLRTTRATYWALRQQGRVCAVAAKAAAPVYRGADALSQRAFKADRRGAGINRPVKGLLRSSIKPGRFIKEAGGVYFHHVSPVGNRVQLYRGKIEVLEPYMRAGYDAAVAAGPAIATEAMARVWG